MVDWSRFVEIVRNHERFVLTTHVRPDGDALGSQLSLGLALEGLGKDVLLANGFAVPRALQFLSQFGRFRQLGVDVAPEVIESYQVLIVLDTTAWAQLGPMADVIRHTRLRKVVIDHHVSGDDLGAELFKSEEAEATGRLVIEAAEQLGAPLTAAGATAAFVALATDTGWFRFASTRDETYRLAARLVEAGAAPAKVYQSLYENDSPGRLRLMGRAMQRVQTELGGRLIYTWLEQADFEAAGAVPADSEDLINLTLAVGGTQAAVILVEQAGGNFKISFRSRCALDCAAVAEQFGGGGHKVAAGATLPGPLNSARRQTLDAVRRAMG